MVSCFDFSVNGHVAQSIAAQSPPEKTGCAGSLTAKRMREYLDYLDTELGWLRLRTDDKSVLEIARAAPPPDFRAVPGGLLPRLKAELLEYFAGTRTCFTLPRAHPGTDFQEAVWEALAAIPYGETRSYQALAAMIGRPAAARAVGNAVGKNPFLILVPCHRIIRADGALGGFSAGLDAKRILHRIEEIRTK